MKIGKYKISRQSHPLIVAEMSGNHNKSLDRAMMLVEQAAKSGAHMLKLQTYTADTLTINSEKKDFQILSEDSLWKGNTLHSLYDEAHTPWEWTEKIIKRCNELDIICFSTPFDETAVDFLEKLNVPAYKIASYENVHLPLIRKVAKTKKPIIISTGLASISEIEDAVNVLKEENCDQFALLKCTSAYPASPENSNVLTIPDLRKKFNCEVGLSDHTVGIGAALAAISHGATIVEKHFTLDRQKGGEDSEFSIEPLELSNLVKMAKQLWQSLRDTSWERDAEEVENRKFRRSIYFVENMKKGDHVTRHNVRKIRPGFGLPAKYFEDIIGKRVVRDVLKGDRVSWDLLE